MKAERKPLALPYRLAAAATCLALISGCVTTAPSDRALREARSPNLSAEARAAAYLNAADVAESELGSGSDATAARETYNTAAAELTVLLRSADGGRLWNHPLTLPGQDKPYQLRLDSTVSPSWKPEYFTDFKLPRELSVKRLKEHNVGPGTGGALVGIRNVNPHESFAPPAGIAAPVTATLEFHGSDAKLALRQPAKQPVARLEGASRPLAADYSAALAYYRPPGSALWVGLMGALRSSRYIDKTGLYFLQPYDPDRIPVLFVHGLISTPFTWIQTMNELQADPEIRARYQFWVFAYPTGYPPVYSALLLRQELAKVDRLFPDHRGYVLVGHSMGGLVSRMQASNFTAQDWAAAGGATLKNILANSPRDGVVYQSMVFSRNPRVSRIVFVCTPHRGSEMASGGLGRFARSLISLPITLTAAVTESVTGADLTELTGSSRRLPNSITGLSPNNPGLKVLNRTTIGVPYHSIIGDRGKRNSPDSTDGVVPYWSSHLDGARSECIVPGPHSSCELPETVTELARILKLHLRS